MGGSDALGSDQTGIAQYTKVMGHAGLGSSPVQLTTTGVDDLAEVANDFKAHGITQGIEDPFEAEITDWRMFEWSHGRIIHKGLPDGHCSNSIEQPNLQLT